MLEYYTDFINRVRRIEAANQYPSRTLTNQFGHSLLHYMEQARDDLIGSCATWDLAEAPYTKDQIEELDPQAMQAITRYSIYLILKTSSLEEEVLSFQNAKDLLPFNMDAKNNNIYNFYDPFKVLYKLFHLQDTHSNGEESLSPLSPAAEAYLKLWLIDKHSEEKASQLPIDELNTIKKIYFLISSLQGEIDKKLISSATDPTEVNFSSIYTF